jgi:rhodanese-related sulfurtransferase
MFSLKRSPVALLSATDAVALGSEAIMLDVRELHEWNAGHAIGSICIPLGQLRERIAELPMDRLIVCVCRSGRRSLEATAMLRRKRFSAANVQGGMAAWISEGLTIEGPLDGVARIL